MCSSDLGFLADDQSWFLGLSKTFPKDIDRSGRDIFESLHNSCVGDNANNVAIASMNLLMSSIRQISSKSTQLEIANMLNELSAFLKNGEEENKEVSS